MVVAEQKKEEKDTQNTQNKKKQRILTKKKLRITGLSTFQERTECLMW